MAFLIGASSQVSLAQDTGKVSALTPQMEREVKEFLGTRRVGHECYFYNIPLYKQVLEQMQLPDEPFSKEVGVGWMLFSGGKPHDYGDSAAVLYDQSGRVDAIAMDGCDWVRGESSQRTRESNVYVYVRDDRRKDESVNRLKAWRGYAIDDRLLHLSYIRPK